MESDYKTRDFSESSNLWIKEWIVRAKTNIFFVFLLALFIINIFQKLICKLLKWQLCLNNDFLYTSRPDLAALIKNNIIIKYI
jgi:hypothetical protein